MEILVKGTPITHLKMNYPIRDCQRVFRNKRNCLIRQLDLFAQVIDTNDTDNNKAVDLVYLHFQKTFDTVPDEKLMIKVTAHGIQDEAARWIRNWLA